jgi:hypothetical protein
MFRPLPLLATLLVLASLVLIVPIVGLWRIEGRVHNAAQLLAPQPAEASTFINITDAQVMCQHFVGNRLQTGEPLKFPPLSEVETVKVDQYLAVTGYVDAPNDLGEPTRTPYTCNVKPAPGGQWRLVSLDLSQ